MIVNILSLIESYRDIFKIKVPDDPSIRTTWSSRNSTCIKLNLTVTARLKNMTDDSLNSVRRFLFQADTISSKAAIDCLLSTELKKELVILTEDGDVCEVICRDITIGLRNECDFCIIVNVNIRAINDLPVTECNNRAYRLVFRFNEFRFNSVILYVDNNWGTTLSDNDYKLILSISKKKKLNE